MKNLKMLAGLILAILLAIVISSCVSTGSTGETATVSTVIEGKVPYAEGFKEGFTSFGPGHFEPAGGGKPLSFYASSDAADGDVSVGVRFQGDNWGGVFCLLDKNVDISSFTTLSFMVKLTGKITDVDVKLEGPRGNGVGVKLSKYTPAEGKNGFKLYKIPLADFVMKLKSVRIAFALWNARNASGGYAAGDVLFDAVSYE